MLWNASPACSGMHQGARLALRSCSRPSWRAVRRSSPEPVEQCRRGCRSLRVPGKTSEEITQKPWPVGEPPHRSYQRTEASLRRMRASCSRHSPSAERERTEAPDGTTGSRQSRAMNAGAVVEGATSPRRTQIRVLRRGIDHRSKIFLDGRSAGTRIASGDRRSNVSIESISSRLRAVLARDGSSVESGGVRRGDRRSERRKSRGTEKSARDGCAR